MAQMNNTTPAALLDEPMRTLYDLLGQLIECGLTPDEARGALCAMVVRVLEVHPATAPSVNE